MGPKRRRIESGKTLVLSVSEWQKCSHQFACHPEPFARFLYARTRLFIACWATWRIRTRPMNARSLLESQLPLKISLFKRMCALHFFYSWTMRMRRVYLLFASRALCHNLYCFSFSGQRSTVVPTQGPSTPLNPEFSSISSCSFFFFFFFFFFFCQLTIQSRALLLSVCCELFFFFFLPVYILQGWPDS